MQHSMKVLAAQDSAFGPGRVFTWDEIGERHPHIYGDPEVHGEEAAGADGAGIGWAVGQLAYARPGHDDPYESPYDLDFRLQDVPVSQIDHVHHNFDYRVRNAYNWYQDNPEEVVPPVLVHRHGVYQVADGHHRSDAANYLGLKTIPAYVAQSPHENEPFSDGRRGPFHGAEPLEKQATHEETDEEFWARMDREHPGQQNTQPHLESPDQAEEFYDEPDAPLPVDDDWDDFLPRNTSLAEHAHVMRSGFRWNGDERYPKYEREPVWRDILDSDGRHAEAKDQHVIERNTHVVRPVLDEDERALAYPWMHTYYPAGQWNDEALTAGYNTAQQATRAADQLSVWGTRHPESQNLLAKYRYVGDDSPYDPSVELPHEAAMRAGPRA